MTPTVTPDCNRDAPASFAAPPGSAAANPAVRWLNGEISTGKLLQLAGVPRGCGDDLAGMIWQAFDEKVRELDRVLKGNLSRAEADYKAACAGEQTQNTVNDMAAEMSRKRAYQETRALLRFHVLGCIEMTQAAGGEQPNAEVSHTAGRKPETEGMK